MIQQHEYIKDGIGNDEVEEITYQVHRHLLMTSREKPLRVCMPVVHFTNGGGGVLHGEFSTVQILELDMGFYQIL